MSGPIYVEYPYINKRTPYRELYRHIEQILRNHPKKTFRDGVVREATLAAVGKRPYEATEAILRVLMAREITSDMFVDGAGI